MLTNRQIVLVAVLAPWLNFTAVAAERADKPVAQDHRQTPVPFAVLGTARVPDGHWFLFRQRAKDERQAGCSVLFYHDEMGYAGRAGGPVVVE